MTNTLTSTFADLGLSEKRCQLLADIGFESPTQIQTEAIPLLLSGRDMLAQSQTGTGKTAAFALPLMDRIDPEGDLQALILTPTRELAQQVAEAMKDFSHERRLFILNVYGGQSIERQIRSLERGVQIVVGTPGRVIDLIERKKLKLETIQWVVLDEADEMLSMGFIDDVKTILRKTPPTRQTACFSATMPREIKELVNQFLNDPSLVTVKQTQSTPTRIEQQLYHVPRGWSKAKALQPILEMEDPESAIIFVRTKQTAADLTSRLQEAGHSVDEYHGNLSQSQRERLVHRFRDGKIKLVVATDIAARGLDVNNLSHVVNFDLPDNAETYIHRIGRTGRAGKTGKAIALVEPIDRRLLRSIENRLKQQIEVCAIPNRSQVEAKRIEKLQEQLKEALAGERMASFLPLVRELSDEYDAQAIAAAALQMIYDQSCPHWMKTDWEVPEVDFNKPVLRRNRGGGGGQNKGGGYQGKPGKPRRSSGGRRPAYSDRQQ
ncbi:DEAD/DEAH box helicase [Synechocystis salina]|uniref:DEAD/DEAH box helicase n=1 Tax=Synechocystis salina TaxID=945780 RepID=UPI001D14F87E|nr:DEAD/DEAH box helicase [Synechocystis salina]